MEGGFTDRLQDLAQLGIGYGSPDPELVVVVSSQPSRRSYHEVALHSAEGAWLFAALRSLGVDELRVMVVRARHWAGQSRNLKLQRLRLLTADAPWLVLGKDAVGIAGDAACDPFARGHHPGYRLKRKAASGVEGYTEHIRRALAKVGWKQAQTANWPSGCLGLVDLGIPALALRTVRGGLGTAIHERAWG